MTSVTVAYAEARAGLARARRGGRLSPRDLEQAKSELEERWTQVVTLEVEETLARAAGEVAERFALRAYDAVHLAAALELADEELVVATWDGELAEAALVAGLIVAP